ncbi:MAG: hypothetical protein WDO19_09465 [Bacteroidota bacterium]
MPKLLTNNSRKPIPQPTTSKISFCISSYEEYIAQREIQDDITQENIQQLTTDFKEKISDPINALNPDIEMGEYFVIPVNELKQMLESGDDPDFIHVCNALRETKNLAGETKTFPVSILVPVKKVTEGGEMVHKVCNAENSIYIEAYPCPPDPRCPKTNELIGIILEKNARINNFNSLF